MKPIFSTIILVAALLVVNTYCSTAQTPEQLYQKGLGKEEGEGALQDAISLYNQVADNSNASISLRAKALLHIGMCFEKLGTKEAVKAYQRLVANFTTQKNEVAYARERLIRLAAITEKVAETPLAPKFTKIQIPTKLSRQLALSPDGKRLLLVSDEKLWIMPLSGNLGSEVPGKPEQLNTDGIKVSWAGLIWSGDGKSLAFNELSSPALQDKPEEGKKNRSTYIISAQGGKPRKIIDNYITGLATNYKISLSQDGKKLAYTSIDGEKQKIYIISTDGGTPKLLVDTLAREPVFSPDGKMIAYVEDKSLGAFGGGLWIIPASGGTPTFVARAVNAGSPVWSPDASKIAFLDYNDNKKVFIIPVGKDGKPAGEETTINAPEGITEIWQLTGWSPDNKIGVIINKVEYALYTLPEQGGQAAMVFRGDASQPRWSPDGKQILFLKRKETKGDWSYDKLAIMPADGGKETNIMSSYDNQIGIMGFQTGVNISPNGKQIVISAKNYDEGVIINNWPACQIWTTSIKGENLVQITKPPEPYTDFSPCWSPDGKSIAFVRSKLIKDPKVYGETSIYTVNSSGGEPKLLMTEPDVICSIKWSPDGKYIAYLNNNGLNIIEAQNGISRIVGKVPRWTVHTELAWSPDSKRIAFNDPGSKAVKVISVEDGHIQDIETGLIDINIFHLDWSPDGKRFVFVGYMGGEPEFWFLENFLPLEKLVQKKEKENLKESKGIKIRQVWTGSGVDNTGNVSADGKYLSFTNWETGNLMIRNLTTSENRQLTNDATWDKPQQYAESSLISPDGKQVAYLWYYDRGDKGYYELRLIQVGNQTTTNLYSCSKNEYVMPKLWTSDNKKIIFQNYVSNNIWQLSSIDVTSREVRLLKEKTKPLWIPNLSLSPDDKYLAFDFPNPSDKGNYDIYLMSIDSKNELPIVEHPANDRLLGWLPGRNELLFFSDRSGKWDLWAIPVDNGKPSGLVKRIYADIGEADPMGLTHTGDCYLGISRSNYNTYIVPFNVETGVVKEESGKSLAGSNTWVKWSPDGQYLTYIKDNKKTNYPWQLTIQDIKTGEERKVANNLLTARSLCWSPEGNSILAVGHDKTKFSTKGYKGGIYKTDIRTGLTTEILNISDYKYNAPEDETYPLSNVEWSSDGKSIFYLFFTDRLVKRNLETGEDKILYKNSRFVRNILQRSPDGKDLLFGVFSPEEKKSRLFTIPVDGGKEKELCTSQEAISFNSANWSPDGKCIYFLDSDGNNFWRVSAEGGMPQKVWYSKSKIRSFDINPNETQIVLVKPEQITEIRVIENLVQELEKVDNQNEK